MKVKTSGKFITGIFVGGMLLAPAAAMADCTSWTTKLQQQLDIVHGKQTGGLVDAAKGPNYVDPDVQKAKTIVEQATHAGCNLGSQWQAQTNFGGGITSSEYAPDAPGGSNGTSSSSGTTADTAYNSSSTSANGNSSSYPVPSISASSNSGGGSVSGSVSSSGSSGAGGGSSASGSGSSTTAANTPSVCGSSAVSNLSALKNSPSSAANLTQFGLVQSAYTGTAAASGVTGLASDSPSSFGTGTGGTTASNLTFGNTSVIASNNTFGGTSVQPNGCRLANYQSCGQAGDVIMIQTNQGDTASSGYDTYLVYAGDGTFYGVQTSNGVSTVTKGPLPPGYSSMDYAAVRQTCGS